MNNKLLLVIAPEWPSAKNGYGLALNSSLTAYRSQFDNILLVVLSATTGTSPEGIDVRHIPIKKMSKINRFINTLFSFQPAVTYQYLRNRDMFVEILNSVKPEISAIIIEDIPLTCLIPCLREIIPNINIAIRSHNVLTAVFKGFVNNSVLTKPAWFIEYLKIRAFERKSLSNADAVWAISDTDKNNYIRTFGFLVDGIIDIYIDTPSISSFQASSSTTILHLGTINLRKEGGINKFLQNDWPAIKEEIPEAKIIFAGRGTEVFHSPDNSVFGIGYISDEKDFFKQGLIFLNPQEFGSGIKIKSIVAMSYGKILITTDIGIEGIEAQAGYHYLKYENNSDLKEKILHIMKSPDKYNEMHDRCIQQMDNFYSLKSFLDRCTFVITKFKTYCLNS